MRTRVYRNFTFKLYDTTSTELVARSDNFFTVESQATAILKDYMAKDRADRLFYIVQEAKDGSQRRVIETIKLDQYEETIYISQALDLTPSVQEESEEPKAEEQPQKSNKKSNK